MASTQQQSQEGMSSDSQNTEAVSTGALKSKSSVSNNHKSPKQKTPVEPPIPTIAVFYAFLLVNTLAAAFVPIQDCDEVFNYWEPTHYLNRGSGLQTWEYSPEYTIRSWLYIVIHAIVGKIGSLFSSRTTAEFYFIRLALGAVCAACETRLFSTICKTFNTRVGIMFAIVMATSPGMFHASVAYLPSSFSMYMTMLGMAAFMDWRGGLKTGMGMMWFGIGAIVGWPFSGALIIPLLAEDFALSLMTGDISEIVYRYLDGVIRSLLVLALQVAIDAFFYHEVTVVPWNIVSYNVFSGSSRGPDIFGTESWDFYIRNLCLNFNIWFVLALFVGPILGVQFLLHRRSTTKQSPIRSLVFVAPFYLWIAIFSAQGHKEERFMYPAYPFLALGAAIALHTTLTNIGSSDPARLMGKIPAKLKLYVVSLFVLLALDISIARTIGIVTAYRAPLQIYAPLQENRFVHTEANVCLGKDWYRFPSSYFLPNGMRAKFIKSAFDGLLPGQFTEAKTGFGFFPGTWLIPPGMNDQNLEDPGKHVDIDHCSFLVDSYFPNVIPSPLEPNYVEDNDTWEEMRCSAFLDASQTNFVGRILWIPDLEVIPARYRRRWGRHCLLQRRSGTK
ncbi:mannosyltransferase [Xanthoria calcicola]